MALRGLRADDPAEVGGFRLHGRLGNGGMGAVYLGFDPSGAPVAVKTLPLGVEPGVRRRFTREAELLAGIRHPRVAALVDADVGGERPWLAMEYVPGPSLAEVATPLPLGRLEQLASGLAEALAVLHRGGVTHRDVKPSNVILTFDGPVLVDLGVAASAGVTSLTAHGMVVGTPAWMAPEQLIGIDVGPPADVWGWAVLVCYAATGRRPFADGPLTAVAYRIQRAEPDLSGVPQPVHRLVAVALSKDPSRRPTAGQLADATATPMVSLRTDAPTLIDTDIGAGAAMTLAAGTAAPDGTLLALAVRAVASGMVRRTVAAGLGLLALACVVGPLIAEPVADAVSRVDQALLWRIAAHREPWLTSAMRAVAVVGRPAVVTVAAGLVAGLVWWRIRRAWPWLVTAMVLAGAVATWAGTAALIGRPRPAGALRAGGVSAHGTGYPSLSTTVAAAGLGLIATLVCSQMPRLSARAAIGSGAVAAAFGVGTSQVYLGVQWMSDAAVGWLLGAAWLAVVLALPRPAGQLPWPIAASRHGPAPSKTARAPEKSATIGISALRRADGGYEP
jgi:membrane-associated phospholipid phosphatase